MSDIETLEDLENAPVVEPTADQREIEFLKASLNQVAAERDRVGEQNSSLRAQLDRALSAHRADIATIGESLISEANDREWCSEYDEIVDKINRSLTVELPLREREHTVTVTVTLEITVMARDEDHAHTLAQEIAGNVETYADRQAGTYSRIGDYEIELV